MEARKFYQYLKAIEPVQAQETLSAINATTYPHLQKSKRSQVYKAFQDTVRHSVKSENKKPAKFGDVRNTILKAIRRGR